VPAGLTVLDCAAIEVEPDALESTQGPGAMADLTLVISNVGVSNLNWSFSEAAAPLSLPQHGPPVVGATAGGHAYGDADLPPLVETGIAVPAAPPRCAAGNGLLFYGDRGSFESDWPGLPVEGFEATLVPSNSLAICAGPFDSTTDNACFAPGGILDGIRFQVAPTPTRELAVFTENFVGAPSVLVGPNHSGDDHEILLLDGGVGAAGFDLYMLFGQDTCEVEIFGPGDALLGQAMLSVPGGVPGAFWGVASFDQPITRIGIRSLAEGGELLDDVAFGGVPLECGAAWASTDPINGTTAPGGGSEVTVTFDSTGYAAGVYTGMLCIESNDAVEPLVAVPLTMTVMEAATIVDITWLADGCQVTFDSTVSGVPPIAYSWDFGDGVGASTAEDPVYTYTAPGGSFSVTLDVDNQWGGSREVLGVSATCRPPFFYIYLPIVARD
jgi:hypothetical protein